MWTKFNHELDRWLCDQLEDKWKFKLWELKVKKVGLWLITGQKTMQPMEENINEIAKQDFKQI